VPRVYVSPVSTSRDQRSRAERAVALAQAAVERHRSGNLDEAATLYEQVIELVPPSAAVLSNLGEAYRRLDRKLEAVATFRRALSLQPSLAAVHFNLGLTLEQLGRFGEAAAEYQAALGLEPKLPNVAVFLLQALREQGEYGQAIDRYERIRAQVPDSAGLRRAVGNALADLFRVDEAIEHFLRAIELDPDSAEARMDYAAALIERGEVPQAILELRRALELDPTSVRAHASLIYLLALPSDADAQVILSEARRFDAMHCSAAPRPAYYANPRNVQRRLRIGYVSPDFRAHPVALFLPEVLRQHDRTRVEVFCYSNVRKPDLLTAKINALTDEWREIDKLSDDDAAAALVAQDQIDVLVDLAMHTGQSRPLLFARKPAPVQACWLAYPGTTGLEAMDYRLTDSVIDPPEQSDASYSEQSIRLPGCFWCYAPPSSDPAVNELPARAAGHVTFGSPNSFKKVSDLTLELWARVLEAVPGSRMLIVAPAGEAWQRVDRAFEQRGVSTSRLERLSHAPRPQYLAGIQRMDCVLDCAPYNGGTASFDAFWMGVPVVTLAGGTAASRAGASIAHHLELPELVATTPDQYVERAVQLSRDLPRLAGLRAGLRPRLQASVLMDGERFARGLEAAYAQMFERWLASTSDQV
jgi:protein O-GlcNAc transferase